MNMSRRHSVLIVLIAALTVLPGPEVAGQPRYGAVVEGILAAWKTADVVCLGENHGRQNDSDLRIALVQHPAFPRTVRVIVVEMANPVHQPLLDRFVIDGESLSRDQLAPVWRDASGAEVWESPIYEQFLRAVRDVNSRLSREQRVRVLGGDSGIDWSRITRAEELVPLVNRGANIRKIIADHVLEPHLKGLAIYGARHCSKVGGGFPGDLAGKYAEGRMWSIWPLFLETGAQKGRAAFGLGTQPAYVIVKGTEWASLPATEMLAEPKFPMGTVTDAVVYHGEGPDRVVSADLTELKAKYGAEFGRRRKLIDEAFKLWRGRGRPNP